MTTGSAWSVKHVSGMTLATGSDRDFLQLDQQTRKLIKRGPADTQIN